jgi:hypothetical protein
MQKIADCLAREHRELDVTIFGHLIDNAVFDQPGINAQLFQHNLLIQRLLYEPEKHPPL